MRRRRFFPLNLMVCGGGLLPTDDNEAPYTHSKEGVHELDNVASYRVGSNQFGVGLSTVAVMVLEVCHAMGVGAALENCMFR